MVISYRWNTASFQSTPGSTQHSNMIAPWVKHNYLQIRFSGVNFISWWLLCHMLAIYFAIYYTNMHYAGRKHCIVLLNIKYIKYDENTAFWVPLDLWRIIYCNQHQCILLYLIVLNQAVGWWGRVNRHWQFIYMNSWSKSLTEVILQHVVLHPCCNLILLMALSLLSWIYSL